uniref:Uncharacterized protein n=1 Tax=Timema bartmani TaxID=61472 RepID=A0A7R9EST5_9NEOP|nr:unnamed protein product [Timema bartmani]
MVDKTADDGEIERVSDPAICGRCYELGSVSPHAGRMRLRCYLTRENTNPHCLDRHYRIVSCCSFSYTSTVMSPPETLVVLLLFPCALGIQKLDLLYQWKGVDFVFPSKTTKEAMLRSGYYIQDNPIPLDVDVWNQDGEEKVFVTLPRFKPGTPATLTTISTKRNGDNMSPLLVPYPDWSWHREGVCDGITSVFRVQVKEGFGNQINLCRDRGLNPGTSSQKSDTLPLDPQTRLLQMVRLGFESQPGLLNCFPLYFYTNASRLLLNFLLPHPYPIRVDACGRLWVIDTGMVDILVEGRQICPHQILVFDIRTSKLVTRYRIPEEDLKSNSILPTIAVDIRDADGKCRDAFAYVADVTGFGLIVYDARHNRSWRVTSNYFYPYPISGYFDLNGETFDLMDGVLGLGMGPNKGDDTKLYFHSLASVRESWVLTSVLRNSSNFKDGLNVVPRKFHVSTEERPSQTAAVVVDENEILFFNLLKSNTLDCWNTRKPYTRNNFVELDRDDDLLQFASGMKISKGKDGQQKLWALTCRFQKHMTGTINPREVNYRILSAPVDQLVRGTACEAKSSSLTSSGRPGGYRPIVFEQ